MVGIGRGVEESVPQWPTRPRVEGEGSQLGERPRVLAVREAVAFERDHRGGRGPLEGDLVEGPKYAFGGKPGKLEHDQA